MPDGSASTATAPAQAQAKAPEATPKPKVKHTRFALLKDDGLAMPSAKARDEFMRADWPNKPRSEWKLSQKIIARFGVIPNWPGEKPAPIKDKNDPVPVWSMVDQVKIILPWCLLPVLAHHLFMRFTGMTVHPVAAWAFYTIVYNEFSLTVTRLVNKMGMKYGFFDGQHPRDGVPDDHSNHILFELFKVTFVRPGLGIMLAYDRNELPWVNLLYLPVKLLVYSIVFDFFFYTYHTATHKVSWLWRIHRTHHMTKHPSSLLSAFADTEQEVWEAYVIVILTYGVLHPWFNFYEWFIATMFIVSAEAGGHSGARIYTTSPMNAWLLRPFGCELILEDHDIHHRHGWAKHGRNMGKQTRLFDVIFGTTAQRIECKPENIDWNTRACLP